MWFVRSKYVESKLLSHLHNQSQLYVIAITSHLLITLPPTTSTFDYVTFWFSLPPEKWKRIKEDNATQIIMWNSQFWFKDGSIVVQAKSTQYCIHESILSLHLNILKDCFRMPQPGGEPTVDGCPMLHMTDSSCGHWTPTLTSLWDLSVRHLVLSNEKNHNWMFMNHPYIWKPIPFEMTSTTIRLGRKYELNRFVNAAIGQLMQAFLRELKA